MVVQGGSPGLQLPHLKNDRGRVMKRYGLKGSLVAAVLCAALAGVSVPHAAASEGGPHIDQQPWSFSGFFGTFDRAQLQRGYQVYQDVCAGCHSMRLLSYRNLSEAGGPEFSLEAVKALAAEVDVQDGPNAEGEMFDRPGKPSDRFVSPYANDKEAAAANGGAMPPDLSVMGKARGVPHGSTYYTEPYRLLKDVLTAYQEGGPDYIYALMTGYQEAPSDMTMAPGMIYNTYFPGHQIAMPSPLSDELVEYTDGSPQTVDQYARDVSAFLMWTSDTKLEQRKETGFRVMLYLLILSLLMYLVKRKVWRDVAH